MKYAYNGKEIKPVVEIYHDVIPIIGGITEGEFYRDAEKCAKAWKTANAAIADYFGELLAPRTPTCPPLSYGHMVSLGAPLSQPEDAEPNVKPFADSIEDAVAIMKEKKGMDFFDNPLAKHYMEVNKYLQEQFPEYKIAPLSGYGRQGIITSAELMRGQDFFIDIYDDPDLAHEFLDLMIESIIDFAKATNRINGVPEVSEHGTGIADDFASIIPPHMWSEFVIPYWNRFFEAMTTGTSRSVHCENTYPEQLRYLKDAKLTHYQPSVADRLTIENIRANTDVPFDWLLYTYHIVDMSDEQIEAWVDNTVKAGITTIRTQFGRYAWSIGKMDRILAFYKAFEKYRVE